MSQGCKLQAHFEVHSKRSFFSACALESYGADSLLSRQVGGKLWTFLTQMPWKTSWQYQAVKIFSGYYQDEQPQKNFEEYKDMIVYQGFFSWFLCIGKIVQLDSHFAVVAGLHKERPQSRPQTVQGHQKVGSGKKKQIRRRIKRIRRKRL